MRYNNYKAALRRYADDAVSLMKEAVPVQTGTLRDSIKYSMTTSLGLPAVEFEMEWYGENIDDRDRFIKKSSDKALDRHASRLEAALVKDLEKEDDFLKTLPDA